MLVLVLVDDPVAVWHHARVSSRLLSEEQLRTRISRFRAVPCNTSTRPASAAIVFVTVAAQLLSSRAYS